MRLSRDLVQKREAAAYAMFRVAHEAPIHANPPRGDRYPNSGQPDEPSVDEVQTRMAKEYGGHRLGLKRVYDLRAAARAGTGVPPKVPKAKVAKAAKPVPTTRAATRSQAGRRAA